MKKRAAAVLLCNDRRSETTIDHTFFDCRKAEQLCKSWLSHDTCDIQEMWSDNNDRRTVLKGRLVGDEKNKGGYPKLFPESLTFVAAVYKTRLQQERQCLRLAVKNHVDSFASEASPLDSQSDDEMESVEGAPGMCRYFKIGQCTRSDRCKFLHAECYGNAQRSHKRVKRSCDQIDGKRGGQANGSYYHGKCGHRAKQKRRQERSGKGRYGGGTAEQKRGKDRNKTTATSVSAKVNFGYSESSHRRDKFLKHEITNQGQLTAKRQKDSIVSSHGTQFLPVSYLSDPNATLPIGAKTRRPHGEVSLGFVPRRPIDSQPRHLQKHRL